MNYIENDYNTYATSFVELQKKRCRTLAYFVRYLNKINLKMMDITEDEMMRFLDESDNDIEFDEPVPSQLDFTTPAINADSINITKEWFEELKI